MTKISNFTLDSTDGTNARTWKYNASVDVATTTGHLWWKKTTIERKKVQRSYTDVFWFFVDNGEYDYTLTTNALAWSWSARTGQKC